jgi:hypothetical protein
VRGEDQAVLQTIALSHIQGNPPVFVRAYGGTAEEAASDFASEAQIFALHGYLPVSQAWAPGAWNSTSVMLAVVLSIFAVGLLILAYMLVASPDGVLTVVYRPSAVVPRP